MSIASEKIAADSPTREQALFGPGLFRDFLRLTERYAGVDQSKITEELQPISERGTKYLSSLFGVHLTESLGLRWKDIDGIIDTLKRVNNGSLGDDEALYRDALSEMLRGSSEAEIAESQEVTQDQIEIVLGELWHRTYLQLERHGARQTDQQEGRGDENWPDNYGREYLDAHFGKGIVESLNLTHAEVDLVIEAVMQEELNNELRRRGRQIVGGLRYKDVKQTLLLKQIKGVEEELPLNMRSTAPLSKVSSFSYVYDEAANPESWPEDGLCQQIDQGINTGEHVLNTSEAKRVCDLCRVSQMCLRYALDNNEQLGIWGGLSIRQRRALKHAREADGEVA